MRARRHSVVRLALSATAVSLALAVGLSGGANASRTAVAATLSSCVITQDRSVGSTTTTSIEFVNQTAGTVTVYWLAFDGSRQFWFNLPAGQSIVQNTYVGHAWLVTDSTGTCVGYVVAEQAPKRYVIEGGTPPPAPPVSPPPGATTFTDPAGDGGRGAA